MLGKMNNMQVKIETWTKLIQSEQLQNVFEDVQMSIRARPDNKLNDSIFKLLLHLCHTTEKCDKQNYETGKRIAKLTKLLCSLLIKVPHDNNFVKALFKIVHHLIASNLYEDAANICCYLEPGRLYNPQNETMNNLTKVLSLWNILVNDMYLAFTNEPSPKNYNTLKNIIKYEMKMIRIAYKNYTKHLIVGINVHLDRMSRIDEEANKYFDDFYKYILECLREIQLYMDEDEKYSIYCHILCVICHITCRDINSTNIIYAAKTFNELSGYFKSLLAEDEECYQCFQQFQSFCVSLLLPVENIMNNSVKDIENVTCHYLDIAKKYGYTGGLKWNMLSFTEIIEPIFVYWRKCIKIDKNILDQLFNTGLMMEIMNLFVHMNIEEFYNEQISVKCKWCAGKLCTIKRDLFNLIIMKCKCMFWLYDNLVKNVRSEKICILARKILEDVAKLIIREIRESDCKRWTSLWDTCYGLIYNLTAHQHDYKESIRLCSFLCSCTFRFQEITLYSKCSENSQMPKNIIGSTLYKLSIMHYNNGAYREAMTASALHALLDYNEPTTKAFHVWTSIKKHASKEMTKLNILECLREDKDKLKNTLGFSLDISKYDLIELCSREAKNLLEKRIAFTDGVSAVLEELKKLEPNVRYAHAIQLLGHYLLAYEYDSSVLQYHKQAVSDLKQNKLNSTGILCLEANLNLFTFAEELRTMNEQTAKEMEKTEFALYASKLPELTDLKSPNIVPAYTMINVKKDSSLMLSLHECLKKWNQLFNCDMDEIIKYWEPNLILDILIVAGEYSRLYRYEDCEAEAWKLAYRLATEINDHRAIIYITGRCISLREINYDWIVTAKDYATKHKDSKDKNIINAIAVFWISLADLYLECGKWDEAKLLLTEARSLPGISFLANTSVYLLSLDVIIRNSNSYKDNMQQNHDSYIVESLYAMRNLNHSLLTKIWKRAEYLFIYDVIFTTAINLSMRINSLLSFRGISADLVQHLKSAQSLGAVMRIAELLKSLCYIDLSRSQLDDCEVKLQGLEHMLDIETFQLSMNSEPIQTTAHLPVTPTKLVDPIRDASPRDASPVLGKKIFDLPKFTLHENCDCYKCSNASYQYLVFATTYIRAQLYALQSHNAVALDHFHGAFEIRQRLFEEKKSVIPENSPCDEIGAKRFSWQVRFYIIDYVYLLIDFCYFLKTIIMSARQDALDIANLAINVCHKYKLEGHPVYTSVKELEFDNYLQPMLDSSEYLGFTVPQPRNIDANNYAKVTTIPTICVTPSAQNHRTKEPLSIGRKKNPIPLKINKVNLIWSDDEDDDGGSSTPFAKNSNKRSKSQANLVKRKIFEEDVSDDANSNADSRSEKTKLGIHRNGDINSTQRKSIKDIMNEVVPSIPNISQNLMDLVDESDVPATTENLDKLIEKVENLRIESTTVLRRKSVKGEKQLSVADYNKNVSQAIKLLRDITINGKINDVNSSMPTNNESSNIQNVEDQETPKMHNVKKFFKSGGIKTKQLENASPLINVSSRRIKRLVNNEISDVKRSSLRISQKKKS